MKKTILAIFAFLACLMTSSAQDLQVATLTHHGKTTSFYGGNALEDALKVADNGDVINLSAGTFIVDDYHPSTKQITKALTIRGVGIDSEFRTVITGLYPTFKIPDDVKERLYFEGLFFECTDDVDLEIMGNINQPQFVKCRFNGIIIDNANNAYFVQCKIHRCSVRGGSVNFINSYVGSYDDNNNDDVSSTFNNCILYTSGYFTGITTLYNCILTYCMDKTCDGIYLNEPVSAYNCYVITPEDNFDSYATVISHCMSGSDFSIFKTFKGIKSIWPTDEEIDMIDKENFELTASAATAYLGTDGTQVGMHGGMYPYNPVPQYPRITNLEVAPKSTSDGKLNVTIEVSNPK